LNHWLVISLRNKYNTPSH